MMPGRFYRAARSRRYAEPQARFVATDDARFLELSAIHEQLRGKPPLVLPANFGPGGKEGYPFRLDVLDELDRRASAALWDGGEGVS